ncbi:MAG: diguanylate cyclase, partial [Burkholderiaceae bacterium]
DIPASMATLRELYASEPEDERRLVASLQDAAEHKLTELDQTVALRQSQGLAAVEPIVSAGAGKRWMDQMRSKGAELVAREGLELDALERDLSVKMRLAIALSTLSALISIGVFALLGRGLWQAILNRESLSEQARVANERLEAGMQVLRTHNAEVSALGEMARVLQAEMSMREALAVTAVFCARLLPGTCGVIQLFRNSADLLEHAADWGDVAAAAPTMEPKSCWGLRLGRAHRSDDSTGLRCGHLQRHGAAEQHLCIPLMAYGDVLGLLTIASDPAAAADPARLATTAQAIAEQVALSLSNAKLRQVLRDQSIKDPLTGLFNRRYMEETLGRELVRAERQKTSLSLIVLDIDHFKHVNDTHGHPAGDSILRKTGHFLGSSVRESDVACRYGGEEFILILPDCPKEAAVAKARELCERTRVLAFPEAGGGVQITASFGVSSFPADGIESQGLVQAADAALYVAKRNGRNRVAAAGDPAQAAGEDALAPGTLLGA